LKWFNAVFRGEPYQLGNPVHETVIRIEEISRSRLPDKKRVVTFYGELGELDAGDDVTVTAVQHHGRLEAQAIRINDLEMDVRAQGQIPGGVMAGLSLMAAALIVLFVAMVVSFFTSGGIWTVFNALVGVTLSLAGKLLVTLMPLIILYGVYRLFFHRR